MNLMPALFCALIIITIHAIHSFNSTYSSENNGQVRSLRQWIQPKSDLVYLKCGNHFGNTGNGLMRRLAWKYTRLSDLKDLFNLIFLKNMHLNTRTVLVTATNSKGYNQCRSRVMAKREWFLVDIIILNYENHHFERIRCVEAHRGRGLDPTVTSCLTKTKTDELGTIKNETEERFSRKCLSFEIERPGKLKASFDGCDILFACRPTLNLQGPEMSCDEKQFNVIQDALRAFNATSKFIFYTDYTSMARDIVRGHIDINLKMTALGANSYSSYAFPKVLEYTYETFYTWKGESEESFFTTVIHSNVVIGYLLGSMVVSWLALCLGQFLEFGWHIDGSLVIDFATFLFASFLATSAPIPCKRASCKSRWCAKSQTTVIVVWMLGIFPLSFYLRGELTSRLTVRVPPNPIDTIEELEGALDEGLLTPCMVTDGALRFLFGISKERLSSLNNIYKKLKVAFHRKHTPLRYSDNSDCLRFCARKPGYACFMYSQEDCPQHTLNGGFVESREPLKLVFGSIPVRKDFARAKAFENLLGRIFETALNPHDFNNRRQCNRVLKGLEIDTKGSNQDDSMQTSQVFKLSMFFATFSVSLLLASIVFCLEVAMGSRR